MYKKPLVLRTITFVSQELVAAFDNLDAQNQHFVSNIFDPATSVSSPTGLCVCVAVVYILIADIMFLNQFVWLFIVYHCCLLLLLINIYHCVLFIVVYCLFICPFFCLVIVSCLLLLTPLCLVVPLWNISVNQPSVKNWGNFKHVSNHQPVIVIGARVLGASPQTSPTDRFLFPWPSGERSTASAPGVAEKQDAPRAWGRAPQLEVSTVTRCHKECWHQRWFNMDDGYMLSWWL